MQLAKAAGATVTGVDEASKLDLIRSLGADHVIDYRKEDFTRADERYDVIFDVPGNHSFAQCRRALTADGTYVSSGTTGSVTRAGRWLGSMPRAIGLMVRSPFVRQLPSGELLAPPQVGVDGDAARPDRLRPAHRSRRQHLLAGRGP